MKKLILLLIIPFLLPDHLSAQTALNYFSMHIGDYRILHADTLSGVYQPSTFREDIEAIDLIDGDEYFRMRQSFSADDSSSESQGFLGYFWIRVDSTGAVIGAFGDTSIVDSAQIFDTPLPVFPNEASNLGYSWEFVLPGTGIGDQHWDRLVESISETVEVPAGQFNDCIKIRTIITDSASGDTTYWIDNYHAEGIGQVLFMGWNIFWGNHKFELIEYSVQPPVGVKNSPSVPTHFRLHQNYPNPFNPSTIIFYSIQKSDFVTLKIYDILGREIQTLVSEFQKVDTYSINFDASKLSSGMYFYQLQVGDFVETKKMLFLR